MKLFLLLFLLFALVRFAAAQPCNVNLNLSSQSQVNAFAAAGGCSTVASLAIRGISNATPGGDQIVDLTPLASITAVTGNVTLVLQDLVNIQGLNNIIIIGGQLSISGATSLTDLSINVGPSNAFSSLSSIGEGLYINGNPSLVNISGFFALQTATHVSITQNPMLGALTGFNQLRTPGRLTISYSPVLRSITGFANLASLVPRPMQGGTTLEISNNPLLEEILGLGGLRDVDYLTITNNASLQRLAGFNNLRTVQSLSIIGNGLTSITGFNGGLVMALSGHITNNPQLQVITGFAGASTPNLDISANARLLDIAGFNTGTFTLLGIGANPALTSISGFRNAGFTESIAVNGNARLDSVTGFTGPQAPTAISLTNNPLLRDFARGFAFGSYSPLTGLTIQGNGTLAACAQPWVCTYLRRNGSAFIANNAPACTAAGILQNCQPLATKPPVEVVAAYPNPVTEVLYLSVPGPYTVRDLLGRQRLQGEGAQVYLAGLPAGVYLVESGQAPKRGLRITKQ